MKKIVELQATTFVRPGSLIELTVEYQSKINVLLLMILE